MSKKHSRAILLSVPLVLLALVGAWWALSGPGTPTPAVDPVPTPRPTPSPQVAAPAPDQAPPPKASAGTRAWVPGTLYRYALSAKQDLAFRQTKPGAGAPPGMKFAINGDWNVGVVSVGKELIHARVQLKTSSFSVDMEGDAPLAPEVRRTLTAALELPFFLSFDQRGLVKLTHFEKGADVLTRGLLRALVSSSQFVVAGVPQDTWQAEEHDTTGQYLAQYQRLTVNRFEKKKLSYSHVTTPMGMEPVGSKIHIDVRASSTFELEEDLWTRTLEGSERLDVDAGEGMPAATYLLSVSLRLVERLQDPSLLGSFEARRAFLGSAAMSSFQGVEQDPMDQYRQVLAGKDFDTLIKELRSLPKEPKAREEARTRVLEQLRALFMLHPAEALKVPGIIRSGMDPLAASPMLGALSAASTKEAIQSMVDVSGDRAVNHDIRMDAIAALGMAGEPNREGVDALRILTQDEAPMLRDTATLALGNASYQMGDADARTAQSLVFELNNAYRAATSPEQQALVLRALGNTRDPAALPTIKEALRSINPRIREAALEALRNIPDPTADQLLSEHLLQDPTSEVRRAAVFSCGFRPLEPLLPALDHALRNDSADGVRLDIIHLMGAVRGAQPPAMLLLTWASQNDPNPDFRKVALDYLNTPATPVPSQTASTP